MLHIKHFSTVLDPCQDACKANRSVEDVILYFTNNPYTHLDISKSNVRFMFIDISSAFNKIQPLLLILKLQDMYFSECLQLWILDFFTHMPQFVSLKTNGIVFRSNDITSNTGAPQGTV